MKKFAYALATLTLVAGPAIALPIHSIPAPPVFSETQVIPAQTMGMERRHERRMHRHGM